MGSIFEKFFRKDVATEGSVEVSNIKEEEDKYASKEGSGSGGGGGFHSASRTIDCDTKG